MVGTDAYDIEGNKVGGIKEIFMDTDTGEPEWIGLDSGGLFGSKHVVVPTDGATRFQNGIQVRYSKDQIKEAPNVGSEEIKDDEEAKIYNHYGLQYSHGSSQTGLPGGQKQPSGGMQGGMQDRGRNEPSEARMTRSEEQLNVGKRPVDAGQVRLRKFVETEPVRADVDLRRETALVERHEVNQPVRDADIREEDVSVNLQREEPVVQKEAVAKEEVELRKEAETEHEEISDELRKERIEVEDDQERKR
jgi:uncharacterized protein (TIGR02271 family)